MSARAEDIEADALKLEPAERARLAHSLLDSLDDLSAAEIEALWLEEAERRDEEMDSDPTAGRDAEDVFGDARARLS